jgi:membrane dipeptidase
MLIVDAHQDLAYNMLAYGRDYTRSAAETRRLEAGTTWAGGKEDSLLGWPDYQRGQVALVFATLYATPMRFCSGELDRLCYADLLQANRLYREQLDAYHRLADSFPERFQLVRSQVELKSVLAAWVGATTADSPGCPVGLVITMEGAEAVRAMPELEEWWTGGVRIIGPAWAGNRFCGGTHEPGGLTKTGQELLDHMASYGFCLDVSHMDQPAVLQAADSFPGTIIASHSNAQALLRGLNTNRHLSDQVIQALLARDSVIGISPVNSFLRAGWKKGERRELVSLQDCAAQIDYICQLAGDAWHVGIGSDFDGGFGLTSVPPEIDTIADLQKLAPLLAERGYSNEDIGAIFAGNWLDRLSGFL